MIDKDLASADMGDGFTLVVQQSGNTYRAVIKDIDGTTVVRSVNVPRSDIQRARMDAAAKFLDYRHPKPARDAFDQDEDEDDDPDD